MTESDKNILQNFYSNRPIEEIGMTVPGIVNTLLSVKMSDLISMVVKMQGEIRLTPPDIPQFSNIEDVFESVPQILEAYTEEDVNYSKMGYFLRDGYPRKEGADKKYGENHMKSAALLGLCEIHNNQARRSKLGSHYLTLTNEEKKHLRPRLCLYIPMIQEYFKIKGLYPDTDKAILSLMHTLSESTQTRRLPNCRRLIHLIDQELEYEL